MIEALALCTSATEEIPSERPTLSAGYFLTPAAFLSPASESSAHGSNALSAFFSARRPTPSADYFLAEAAFLISPSEAPVPGSTAPFAFFSGTATDPTLSDGFFSAKPAILSPPTAYY